MEQANRLTLRSVSRPAPAGLRISDFGFYNVDRNAVTSASEYDTSGAGVPTLERAQLSATSTTA
jgi:hypothetical protein